MNKYEKFDKAELKELQRALRCYISELDWNSKDTDQAAELLEELETEMGERFNNIGNTFVDEE
jgi:hypothetical protein